MIKYRGNMTKTENKMIDALFGSKTRVKLLHLFLNNPGKSFYVREITRLVDEQINSVRRELANMSDVGIITSLSKDNKLFYEVNNKYDYYIPFREIFSDNNTRTVENRKVVANSDSHPSWYSAAKKIQGARIVILAGALVPGSASEIDLFIAGNVSDKNASKLVASIESDVGHEITYTNMSYDEFYYRFSIRDKFIYSIINTVHEILVDEDKIINKE